MKPALLLLVLLATAAVAWALLAGNPGASPSQGIAGGGPTTTPSPAVAAVPLESAPAGSGTVERIAVDPAAPIQEFGQGVRGVVVDDRGQPVAGVQTFLLESLRHDLERMLALRDVPFPPLAQVTTASDGTFTLGLRQLGEGAFELRLLATGFADQRIRGIHVAAGQWNDLGTVTLQRGTVLRGRVTMEGTDLPVPGAEVSIDSGFAFDDLMHRTLPGREKGLWTTVDAAGNYRIDNAPAQGLIVVSAVAAGFARVTRPQIEMRAGQPLEIDFQLPRGSSIQGRVLGRDGRGVEDARIEAWPLVGDGSPLHTTTGVDGAFEVMGLRAVDHRLRVLPREHQPAELVAVAAGTRGVEITVERRASAAVLVRTPDGSILRQYTLGVRHWFAENGGQIGTVVDIPDLSVRLRADEERAVIANLDRGDYVVQVMADGFAKTLSGNFSIGEDARDVVVEVTMSMGTLLRAVVVDEQGKPVAGATVTTQVDGADEDNPVWRMIASMTPDKFTRTSARTDVHGVFALPQLAIADYQLQIEHPQFCRGFHKGVRISAPGEQTLPPIVLHRGALVRGHTWVDGKTQGHVRVAITTAAAPGAIAQDLVRTEATSDNDGLFVTARRLPPGTYELRASTIDASPNADIFRQLRQQQLSAVLVTVAAGQEQVEQDIRITTDH
ncbi:MAG: carboxypeptidase regulatory-like domain-containing protein [Planctomycetes bacterium]|nr:carboxypeptidase regulatory-like domain-containing protein [Planctomycetota bacterium]